MRKFVVEVEATAKAVLIVEAKNADEATEKALRRARAQRNVPGVFSVRDSAVDTLSVVKVSADNARVEVT